ncbi:MAG: isochorismatase family protein [Gammaproteobacteria bacterium]|nr:MAG: isochorismatase family protein [Gammaproteobacteria bacterium]
MAQKTFVEMFGFDHPPARLSQAVVILIDMQREYLDGAVPLPDMQATLKGAADLLTTARTHNTPIFHILNQGPENNLLFNSEGPHYKELAEVTATQDEITVIKHYPNAFAGTNLHALITVTGRKQLIIAGCTTHVCVSATVRAALDFGYQSTVVAKATTSRDLTDHKGIHIPAEIVKQVSLAELRDAFAVLLTMQTS